jgi:hypothetical protein
MLPWYRRMQLRIIVLAAGIGAAGCANDVFIDADPDGHVTIDTGTYGLARHLTGNHQPGTGTPSGTTEPASGRVVRIHALVSSAGDATEVSSPDTYGRFLVNTPVIASTTVDAHGFFQVGVPPGTYSVFISDGDAWFCNGGDISGTRCSVEVTAGAKVRFDIDINYEASY